MASLTDLHRPEPAGGASSRSYALPSRPKHSPSSSLASHVQFRSHRSRSNTPRSIASQTVPEFPYYASSVASDSGKPSLKYKKSRSSDISHQQQQPLTIDVDSAICYQPPVLSSSLADGSPCSSAPTPKDKLKQGLRRFSRNDESLDLSRTAAENEEKFGLGLYSLRSESPLNTAADVNFASTRSHGHHSWSPRRSNEPRSFKPSLPYTLPVSQNVSRSSDIKDPPASMALSSHLFIPPEDEELEDTFGSPSATETLDTHSVVSGLDRFPVRVATSDSPRRSFDILESNTSISSVVTRPRRSTNQSTEATTPQSRTSLDRVFSFNRVNKEPMDPLKRQASIQAARRAFTEREEAKVRKYEERERKAIEREESKRVKEEQRERRRSIAQEQREWRRSTAHERRRSQHSSGSDQNKLVSGPAYSNIKTSIDGPPRPLPPSDIRAIDVPMKKSHPHRSKKHGIKSRYLNFVTWGNVRMLRLKTRGEDTA